MDLTLDQTLKAIADRAQEHDISHAWPELDLRQLAEVRAMCWAIPREFGGDELPAYDLHLQYEKLATASVATALILTQRDAAAGLIEAASEFARRAELLERLAENKIWTTVGIAQLTTSRQGNSPAVLATATDGGYQLDGFIPWCTGVHHSDYIVTGAATDNGQQLLILLPQHHPGVLMSPPMNLVALNCTMTGSIQLRNVRIDQSLVLRGPTNNALSGRRSSLTLGQTFIATGLTQAALHLIAAHDSDRARSANDRFTAQLKALRDEIQSLCQPGQEAQANTASARLRGSCNDLALRTTQAAVALYKGTALLRNHPAQRLAREAMFLLVWSCPNPVIDCTVDLLSQTPHFY